MDKKKFTLTQADRDLLNSISADNDFTAIWKVLAEKHGFEPGTVDWDESSDDLYATPVA